LKPAFSTPLDCEYESPEFEKDGELAAKFQKMTRLEAKHNVLIFYAEAGDVMVFRMRTHMASCLRRRESEGELVFLNRCDNSVQIQFSAPNLSEAKSTKVAAQATFETGLNYGETDDFVYSACPVDTEPTVPFDESGYALIRATQYESH